MSLTVSLTNPSDATIDLLITEPKLVWKVVYHENPELAEMMCAPPKRPGFFARLFGARNEPEEATPLPPLSLAENEALDIWSTTTSN